ncbi:hypothetical protein [Paracidovorax avenae]|uniref:hypothetical protein n=1 Tax=Paracidovorax avenae TaxID=80867 RepID=UPI00131409BD|nr:hypothetical protein [Paracidovorax avenae]
MFNFEQARLPISALVHHVDHKRASQIRGEWECEIDISSDDKTVAAISKTKYFIVAVDENAEIIFSVRRWVFDFEKPGKVTAMFSRWTNNFSFDPTARAEITHATGLSEEALERCFEGDHEGPRYISDPKPVSIDLENGAKAIASYYGLNRAQVSITLRDQ